MTSYLPENRGFRGFFDRFAPNICHMDKGKGNRDGQTGHDGPRAEGPGAVVAWRPNKTSRLRVASSSYHEGGLAVVRGCPVAWNRRGLASW